MISGLRSRVRRETADPAKDGPGKVAGGRDRRAGALEKGLLWKTMTNSYDAADNGGRTVVCAAIIESNAPTDARGRSGDIWRVGFPGHCRAPKPRGRQGAYRIDRHSLRRGRFRRIRGRCAVATDIVGPRQAAPECHLHCHYVWGKPLLIWDPETTLPGERICVTGQISDYQGSPRLSLPVRAQLTEQG